MTIMQKPIKLKHAYYTGVKVTSMIAAIRHGDIISHLNLKRRNTISEIDNFYRVNGYIKDSQMIIVWKFFFNFVLNDFRDN